MKHLSLHDELLHRYKSKCVCDVCGTNRYEIDLYTAELVDKGVTHLGNTDETAAVCCDMSEIFDTVQGYK